MPHKTKPKYIIKFQPNRSWNIGLEYRDKDDIYEPDILRRLSSLEEAYAYAIGHSQKLFGQFPIIEILVTSNYVNHPKASKRQNEGWKDAETLLEKYRVLRGKLQKKRTTLKGYGLQPDKLL